MRRQFVDAASRGHQVVDEDDVVDAQTKLRGESGGVEDPGKIDGVQTAVEHSACNTEARSDEARFRWHHALCCAASWRKASTNCSKLEKSRVA